MSSPPVANSSVAATTSPGTRSGGGGTREKASLRGRQPVLRPVRGVSAGEGRCRFRGQAQRGGGIRSRACRAPRRRPRGEFYECDHVLRVSAQRLVVAPREDVRDIEQALVVDTGHRTACFISRQNGVAKRRRQRPRTDRPSRTPEPRTTTPKRSRLSLLQILQPPPSRESGTFPRCQRT